MSLYVVISDTAKAKGLGSCPLVFTFFGLLSKRKTLDHVGFTLWCARRLGLTDFYFLLGVLSFRKMEF